MHEDIRVQSLNFSYGQKQILKDINLSFNRGRFYSVIGPNGSGKSTFIKSISKILPINAKSVFIDGADINSIGNKKLAQIISVVPQDILIEYDFTVFDIVLMGRSPYKRRFEDFNKEDEKIAEKYMKSTNTWDIRDKFITELSGGETQRVIAARTLTQQTDIILLDEPTSHLDIQYQVEFLKIFRELKMDKVIISVLHDLNLAAIFSDQVIMFNNGQVEAKGTPWEVINKANISNVYNLEVEVFENPISKCPYIIPKI
jgi:iron complex transport system ATP-binding protein